MTEMKKQKIKTKSSIEERNDLLLKSGTHTDPMLGLGRYYSYVNILA